MIRFDEHAVFELSGDMADLTKVGAGLATLGTNVGCPATGSDLACVPGGGGNLICSPSPNVICPPVDNIACVGNPNVNCL